MTDDTRAGLRKKIDAIQAGVLLNPGRTKTDEILELFDRYSSERAMEIEKAYGGCHKCYGKGYATVNDQWVGYDTDQDIGSPGGIIRGGNPIAMKFCTCDRGKQLKALTPKAKGEQNDN